MPSAKNPSSENRSSRRKRDKYKMMPRRLPEKLLQIRTAADLTQAKMIEIINPGETGYSRARISQYEKGIRIPSLIEVLNYARFARVPVETLLDDNLDLPRTIS